MTKEEILQSDVSFQKASWAPISKELTIGEVLEEMMGPKYRSQVNYLRRMLVLGKLEDYNIHKKNLPAVTFCGTFDGKRKKDKLKKYSFLLVIDIDRLTPSKFRRAKQILSDLDYVFSFWVSPSEKGLKGLIALEYLEGFNGEDTDKNHRSAFQQVAEYFLQVHKIKLDESGSDTTRLCFYSYDPNLVIKEQVKMFPIVRIEPVVAQNNVNTLDAGGQSVKFKEQSKEKDSLENIAVMEGIIQYLKSNRLSITSNFEQWYRVAYALTESFSYPTGLRYYLALCRLDGQSHVEVSSKNMFDYCYKNTEGKIQINTIVYYAKLKGYKGK